jgi:branched-subunit amino acid ABC-type transport system permease component
MTLEALLFQALNGLAAASSLFFVGAGLSLIFGVTRIINIAHGSFYMLGLYLAATFAIKVGGGLGFWGGILAAGLVVAALGGLRRDAAAAPHLSGAGTVSAARHLSRCSSSSTTSRNMCGGRRTYSGRALRLARLGRNSRP